MKKKRKSKAPPTPPKLRPKRAKRVTRVTKGERVKTGKAIKPVKPVKKGKKSEAIKGVKKAQAKKGQASRSKLAGGSRAKGKAATATTKRRSGKPRNSRRSASSGSVKPGPVIRASKPAHAKTSGKKRLPVKPVKAKAKTGKPVKRARKGSKSIGAVPGFRGLAEEYATEVTKEFAELLNKGKAALGGFVYVFHLRNNTVDAEWRLPVGRGDDPIDLALQMEEALRGYMLRKGSWVSSGLRFPPNRITPTKYDKWKSLYQAQAYAQRGNKRASNFATLRGIIENMAERKRRKAEWLFIKLHWNVDDIKPTRDEI